MSNDGRSLEQEKFLQTDEELVAQFGATSTDAVLVSGRWMYQSTLYEDTLLRVRVDGEDLPAHWEFFRSYKAPHSPNQFPISRISSCR
jgi:hypothetical protein